MLQNFPTANKSSYFFYFLFTKKLQNTIKTLSSYF